RLVEAESGYREVLRARPNEAKALYYLGLVRFHQGDNASAVTHVARALELVPRNAEVWNTFGGMLIAASRPDEALDAYRRAVELAPAKPESRYNLGICLRDADDIDGAIESLRAAIDLQPDYSKAYGALGSILYQLDRIDEAAKLYAEWSAREP